jgi:hypothetical protein
MAQVKTPDTRQQFVATAGHAALRLSRDLTHRSSERSGIAALGLNAPLLGTSRKYVHEIHLRGPRQTETRH